MIPSRETYDFTESKKLAKEAYELGDLINEGHNYLDAYNKLKLKLGEPGLILSMLQHIEDLEDFVDKTEETLRDPNEYHVYDLGQRIHDLKGSR